MANLTCPYCLSVYDLCQENRGGRLPQFVEVPCKNCGNILYQRNELTTTKYYLVEKLNRWDVPCELRKINAFGKKIKLGPVCKCKVRMEARSGKYGPFWACMGVPGCGMTKRLRKRKDT